ncbi:MAG: carbohydrate kinase family protein [Candidatus Thorarchaeota archaeon]
MYDIVVIGNPVFHSNRLAGPSVYAAATAAKIGIEQLAVLSSVDQTKANEFISGVDALDIPEYFLINSDRVRAVEFQNPSVNRRTSVVGFPAKISIREVPDEFLQTQAVLLSPSLQEITAEFVEWICSSTDALVFLDPQLRGLNSAGRLEVIREFSVTEKTQSYLDVIKPNQLEAELITGESDPYLAAELLVELASETCVITLGKEGSLIYDGADFSTIPAYDTEEVDANGAGDVYLAAFAAQSIAGKPNIVSGAYASSIASLKVENKALEFQIDENEVSRRSNLISSSVDTR